MVQGARAVWETSYHLSVWKRCTRMDQKRGLPATCWGSTNLETKSANPKKPFRKSRRERTVLYGMSIGPGRATHHRRFAKRLPEALNLSYRFRSVAQLCPNLCDPMKGNTPGFPVHHQLPELAQTHVHRVADAIQPSFHIARQITTRTHIFSRSTTANPPAGGLDSTIFMLLLHSPGNYSGHLCLLLLIAFMQRKTALLLS